MFNHVIASVFDKPKSHFEDKFPELEFNFNYEDGEFNPF